MSKQKYNFLNFEYFGKTIAVEEFKKWIFWPKINEKSKIEILKITVFVKNIH